MRLDHLLSKELADPHFFLLAALVCSLPVVGGGGWGWRGWVWWCASFMDVCSVRGRSWVECQWIRCPLLVGAWSLLVRLLCVPGVFRLRRVGGWGVWGGCGGSNAGWVVAGGVSGTLLGPEGPHHHLVVWGGCGCSWWSAPGLQTGVLGPCWCGCGVVGVGGGCGLLVC